ncbi:hypothetical protein HG535_0A07200 [Zygotorulaspora mrakii]|uniref:Uncharacterized protein n=1 Tax=Zygotorulaspora mrakii TaxID=42260 RepID=A0A7H9AWJ3_ZYGMR|nr:uncharacterized protein HG535_0A07200 [Zygotorulaspora mrakii]QLG70778.1 hypothetical protein HG535_0A07200 [Zygotorulaspora mrakii]
MNIWIAASDGKQEVVEQLLAQGSGIDSNVKDPNGYTPVHAAAAYGHIELLKKLCKDYNGDINVRDGDGDTPLHHCEDLNTAKVIVEDLGADTTLTNNEKKTALQSFEEDGEFPDLINYMKSISGIPQEQDSLGIDVSQLNEFKNSIRYTLENDPVDESDPESLARRQKLEAIIQGDNAEQELENYIRDIIRNQLMPQDDDPQGTKRRK